jgi:GR25 family glycosyltransferase involved in LPS biosynthesis
MIQSNNTYDTINSFIITLDKCEHNIYLFFDIFINNNKLYIIAPIYKNFSINYNSIEIYLINNDKKIQLKQEQEFTNTDYQYEPFYIKIYKIQSDNNQEEIEVTYNNITNKYYLQKYSQNLNKNKFLLTTTTLFKDDWNLFDLYYKYYSNQGIEYFYMYYNGESTEEIKDKLLYPNVKLIDWNFQYWYDNIPGEHVAQPGHLQHSLYKYGKTQTQYMAYCDLDEFMFIPNLTLKEFILSPQLSQQNVDTIGFINHWSMTFDGKVFKEFPEKFLKSSEKFTFGHNQRSKCIHKVDSHNYIYIHMPQMSNNKKIIVNENLFLFHFANWNVPDRNKLENPQTIFISPSFKDRLNKSVDPKIIEYAKKIKQIQAKFKSGDKIKIGATKNASEWYLTIISYVCDKFSTQLDTKLIDNNLTDCDIYFYTHKDQYQHQYQQNNSNDNVFKILISGEAIDIDYTQIDLCINRLEQCNYATISYPYLLISLDERHQLNKEYSLEFSKKKNIAFMYHVDYPHRIGIFNKFNKEIGVDSYGKSCNNIKMNSTRFTYTEKETYNDIAVNIYSEYKFVLAIENTIKDMYFTEKLINPILANSIPIYYGTKDAFKIINKKRVIYFFDYKSIDDLIVYIKLLSQSEEAYNKILSEPIFNPQSGITLDTYKSYLNGKLDSALGFTPRIFSNTPDTQDTKINIKLNKTCLHRLYQNLLEGDLIENFTPNPEIIAKFAEDEKEIVKTNEIINSIKIDSMQNNQNNKEESKPEYNHSKPVELNKLNFDIEKIKNKINEKVELKSIDSIKSHIKKYFDLVDIIYWINLERSVDRRVKLEQTLNLFPVKNIRYEAIDGLLISDENLYGKFQTKQFYRRKVEYACLLSHLSVIKLFSESTNNYALILEDDVNLEFLKFWNKPISEIVKDAPTDWDIIMLTYMNNSKINDVYTLNKGNIYSCAAYIINKSAANKLIKNIYKNDKYQLNDYTQGMLKQHVSDSFIFGELTTYVYKYPYFTYPTDNDTNINPHQSDYHNKTKIIATIPWLELYSQSI